MITMSIDYDDDDCGNGGIIMMMTMTMLIKKAGLFVNVNGKRLSG